MPINVPDSRQRRESGKEKPFPTADKASLPHGFWSALPEKSRLSVNGRHLLSRSQNWQGPAKRKFIFLPLTLNFLQRKKYLFPSEKRRPCNGFVKNGMDLSIHRRLAPFPAGKEPLHAARTFLISHPPLPVGPLLFRSPAPSRCSFPCVSLN